MSSGSIENIINKICLQIWHLITYNGWYAIKPNQTKSYMLDIYVKRVFGIL